MSEQSSFKVFIMWLYSSGSMMKPRLPLQASLAMSGALKDSHSLFDRASACHYKVLLLLVWLSKRRGFENVKCYTGSWLNS